MSWRDTESRPKSSTHHTRLAIVKYGFLIFSALIVLRLFDLQVLRGDLYVALAAGQHELYQKLFPERGSIYVVERAGNKESLFPLVTNHELSLLYAVPMHVESPSTTAEKLIEVLGLPESISLAQAEATLFADLAPDLDPLLATEIKSKRREEWLATQKQQEMDRLIALLSKQDDPYEPIRHRLSDEDVEKIKAFDLPGLGFKSEVWRYYPERGMGGHVFGFWGFKGENRQGQYGLEGHFNDELAGTFGEIHSERDAWGNLIAVGTQSFTEKVDGTDLVLTIDRAIQYQACQALERAVTQWKARGGAIIVMDPKTGGVLAMCGAPDYNPDIYNKVADIDVYNNPAIFGAYEPGSVFKAVTMAAAIDSGKVTPNTIYEDTGSVKLGSFTIKNFNDKTYGRQTMTGVLENSINTGTIFAMRQTTPKVFAKYVRDFGFGEFTGIELDRENAGDISNVNTGKEIYGATASFGQGLTVTPLQMINAVSALANGGKLMKPHIISQKIHSNGNVEVMQPEVVRQVISPKAAAVTSGMLVSVVENGHGKLAAVPGYRVAGKTGTAQVPAKNGKGYDENEVVVSFVGFAPFSDPRFSMIVMLDRPQYGKEAATTVTKTFSEVAKFILQYYNVPQDK